MGERDYDNGSAGTAVEMDMRLLGVVREMACELHPRNMVNRPITLDSHLDRDLGFDSLGRVELLARVERAFGVTLREQVLALAETPRDLMRALRHAKLTESNPPAVGEVPALDEVQALPYSARTLVDVLQWHVDTHPDRPHIRLYDDADDDQVLTYRQLSTGAEAVAAGLQGRGLLPGQAVAIMLPTGVGYFYSFFGILLAGGIPVPIYPPARRSQIEDHLRRQTAILNNCRATLLITVAEAVAVARLLKSLAGTLAGVVTVDDLTGAGGGRERVTHAPEDIAFLQYTSGSTGNPKGVILSHANLLANIRADGEGLAVDSTDVFVSWLPLYHDMGLIGAWLGSLYFSVPLVVMSPLSFLSRPERWLWAIHHYGGTLSAAPNFAYELCLNRIDDTDIEGLDLSRWRLTLNGAEPVSAETVRRFSARFGDHGFRAESMFPVFGLAECSVGLCFPPLHREPRLDRIERDVLSRFGQAQPTPPEVENPLELVACGRPLPGHELRVVDPQGRELPDRREGRLQFRGPSATSGYYRNPEATRELFDGEWLNTGDLGYMADGDLFVTGRAKDLIICAGRNIYPQELEETLGELPGVRKGRVVVFGSLRPDSGTERVVVMAETRLRDPGAQAELRARINSLSVEIAGAPPDDVVLAPPGTVLKTSSGKLRRAASRELYERGAIGLKRRPLWWQVLRLIPASLGSRAHQAREWLASRGYAVYAWAAFMCVAIPAWFTAVLLPGVSGRRRAMHRAARFLTRLVRMPVAVQGLKHLPATGTPYVVVANHGSYLDVILLAATLPPELGFVAKGELRHKRIAHLFLRRIEAEFVDRFDKQKGLSDARRLADRLRAGHSLVFFPEGTISRMPGLMSFHMGAFVAATEGGVPVVPVSIRGTRSALRSGTWFPRRGVLRVSIGPPIPAGDGAGDAWSGALKCRAAAREYILANCGEPDLSRIE